MNQPTLNAMLLSAETRNRVISIIGVLKLMLFSQLSSGILLE